jgi:hypothetical protein
MPGQTILSDQLYRSDGVIMPLGAELLRRRNALDRSR